MKEKKTKYYHMGVLNVETRIDVNTYIYYALSFIYISIRVMYNQHMGSINMILRSV